MKLRRTLALAAATAVIGPVVLLSAPAAFAQTETTTTGTTAPAPTETPSGEPSAATPESTESTESASQTATTTPSETESPEGVAPETVSPAPTATESETASAKPTPTASETEDEEEGDDEPLDACEPRPLELSINGLSGKIARGSGWDRFTFTIYNDSKKTVKNVAFFAGAAADEAGEKLFTTKQVRLQALNEADGTWEDIEDLGSSSGYVGEADGIKPGYEVDIDLRLKVEASAPVGAGFSLGGGLVFGDELEAVPCFQDVAYKFQIVDAGNGGGAEPQEGGKIPVPTTKPAGDTAEVTGNLAETGSSSSTPAIALAGGAAVVLGAGAMFVVRRRRNGDAAA
ncbi:LAETG motif-containing sortase-dependent surface protein [Streptomyces sp. NPDC053741]|uniref:LPXTG cell wall anchor domain-containing protein n=1 Tax=[Kitasatospora] papulosa TaxID=1464011 RepID=A0ABZ1KB46_9ACTN|nr:MULTISPECIES: LAETG motif-containing sortase-dependent surface protein [Streptomyces]MDF6064232.1 LPXTG cell wall anchor domain-containing protein [Streptomyces sp. JH010]MDX3181635.1 LAETG motif-containing sortase-dependent surface protein [Streptomyces sp. ME02-7008A-1]MDX3302721.1 LAETG motif-containing sortase-dependent surface protein [Streptomyces sp. ME02-7008A]MEE1777796.1 LAETG motif-containing sortase-dependent surface protein [Streptomyces sp. JV181]